MRGYLWSSNANVVRVEDGGESPSVCRVNDVPTAHRNAVVMTDVVAMTGGFPALAGIDIQVAEGEIVLLAGPNGAGKTTVLRVCAGIQPIARGSVSVLGFDLRTDLAHIRSNVGFVGHRNGLYEDLTPAENLDFWAKVIGASPDEVDAAIDVMALNARVRDTPVSRLSAGQRRRVALAVLVIRRARLWLLDEPHAGLDASGRDELDGILRRAAASGATVVLASHELERATALATRRITISGGVIDGGDRNG